jgi:hypothetical protein
MKHILFAFLLLPVLLFAQYPNSPNKSRLGYQTTGDGLIWRGVAADTSFKPIGLNMPYFQLDTVNGILRRYIRTKGKWQTVGGGTSGLTLPVDSITFNSRLTEPATRELKFSTDNETLVFGAGGTTIEIGQKETWYVKNQTGSTIAKGTAVMAVGTLGSSGRILVSPMVSNGTVSAKFLLGVTATSIANGADGYVISFGKLRKTNTNTWNEGDVLYCSATTPGALTNVEPAPPNLRLPIAFVVNKSATVGVLAIRVQTGNELHELHDVDTTGINQGEGLIYNSTSHKWVASAGKLITTADTATMLANYPSTVGWGILKSAKTIRADTTKLATLFDISGFPSGSGTTNRIPIWTATNTLGSSNALYNSTTKRWTWDSPSVLELPMGTDAQRPSPATTSDFWYNTTSNGLEWYNGTRWAKELESTFNRGTATRIPFFDANGQVTESANLTYTGTRFQTGGSIRFGRANVANDTVSIEKVDDGNSRIVRINNPGSTGAYASGFVFRGGFNGVISTTNTFRVYTNSSTLPGSVYIGNVTESGAQAQNSTINLGVLNKITSTSTYDTGINIHQGSANADAYSLDNSKQFGIFIGGQSGNSNFRNMSQASTFGVFAGYQYQPLINGFGSSWVFVAKNDASTATEILRLQGKDGNICLGCTNARYQLYTEGTGAYGMPRGTVAQRPTIIASTTPIRYNTDSTALEYGESVGTWRQLATRAYARSLVSALPTTNIYTADGSLSANRTLTGGSFWLNLNSNVGIKQATPLQELDVNGDLRVRDSTDLDVTPAHTAITGLLTRDATGWVGAATLGGGLSYSGGVLSSSVSTGTVTSVGLSLPSIFSVSGSPVTTSGTLSASFTGGSSSQFLRGNGAWGNTLFTSTLDTTIFYGSGRIDGGIAPLIMKTNDGFGYNAYREFTDYGYQFNYIYTNGFNDECRLYLGNARGTYASPTSLLKNDRVGGLYFHAYGNSRFNKTAVIRAEIDSIYSGDRPMAKILFGVDENNNAEISSNWRFIVKNERNVNTVDAITGQNHGVGLTEFETIEARLHVKGSGTTTGKTMLLEDSGGGDILTVTDNKTIQAHGYGTQTKEAADLSKTVGNIAAFATDGTVLDYRITRDTFANDANFTVTSAMLSSCQELIITAQLAFKGSDMSIVLPTPSASFKTNKIGIFVFDLDLSGVLTIDGSMYYTTDPATIYATTATTLNTSTFYKGIRGAIYEFICARNVNGTYYWKLKQ